MNPGNSGGPMFNENGAVVGIVTMRLEGKGDQRLDAMGFAVAIDELLPELDAAGVRSQTPSAVRNTVTSPASPVTPTKVQKPAVEESAQGNKTKIIKSFLYPVVGFLIVAGIVLGAWVIWNKNH